MTTVFLVEDETVAQGTLTHAIRQAGFEVVVAGTEATATQIAREASFDAAIVDVSLSQSEKGGVTTFHEDGIRVIEEIRVHNEAAFIIVHSFLLDYPGKAETVREKAMQAGADVVVHRPDLDVARERLRATIENGIRERQEKLGALSRITFGTDIRSQAAKETADANLLRKILKHALPDARDFHVKAVGGGLSGALVMRITSEPTAKKPRLRGILKLSRHRVAHQEELLGNPHPASAMAVAAPSIVWQSERPFGGWYCMLQQEVPKAATLEAWLCSSGTGETVADKDRARSVVAATVVESFAAEARFPTMTEKTTELTYRFVSEVCDSLDGLERVAASVSLELERDLSTVREFAVTAVGARRWNFGANATWLSFQHGDLHPRNILFANGEHTRLIDYGKAAVLPRLSDAMNLCVDLWIRDLPADGLAAHDCGNIQPWQQHIRGQVLWPRGRTKGSPAVSAAAKRAMHICDAIHAAMKTLDPSPSPAEIGDCILFQLLRYSRFSSLPAAKRLLAVTLAADIVRKSGYVRKRHKK